MWYAIVVLLCVSLFLLIRCMTLKKEVKKVSQQLQKYNHRKTNKKIDVSLLDKDIERLGWEINQLIDWHVSEHRKRIYFQKEQQQAVANMSHDLRTPLTSILGYIQMAENQDIAETERKELLAVAKKRAYRLEALLNDFFELSTIESKDYELQSERINLKNVVTDVLMSFYDRFHKQNREPIMDMPEAAISIVADKSAVTRVVENLLSNAIAHSEGNIEIVVEGAGTKARLVVNNKAHSLTEQDISRMFDRFYMADHSRTNASTGLGLSIVKSFMEKMGGTTRGKLVDGKLSIICEWQCAKISLET
ncbi:sensor histidine kinase [Gracilibacillus timonensis]|uniref:sensor histidine kinase n=1 Tax=Gracilibacillus timonensis TaxID=1816696 RepID=UPI0008270AC5|nr:HAMP domain-containing sensor histidine kinase [Gracilibacillus timonensis]